MVTNENSRNTIVEGNGTVTSIPYQFIYFESDFLDIEVQLQDTNVNPVTVSVLVEGTHYTKFDNRIELNDALATGEKLLIKRVVVNKQPLNYNILRPFPAEVHEKLTDRVFMSLAELKTLLTNTIRVTDDFFNEGPIILSAPEDNKALVMIDNGDGTWSINYTDPFNPALFYTEAEVDALLLDKADVSSVPTNITDLTDVSATAPTDGQLLIWNNANSRYEPQTPAAAAAIATTDLTDVSATDPTDGQVLAWNNANSRYEPEDPSGGGSSVTDIQDLGDVSATNPTDGQVLVWNNTNTEYVPSNRFSGIYSDLAGKPAIFGENYRTYTASFDVVMGAEDVFIYHDATTLSTIELLAPNLYTGRIVYIMTTGSASSATASDDAGSIDFDDQKIAFNVGEFGQWPVYAFLSVDGDWEQIGAGAGADGSVDTDKIADSAKNELAPIGSLSAFAGSTAPNKWLICNGAAVSRATYSDLFTIISTVYGIGDGTTTFNLPDLRGEFIRGFDSGRGVDSGRTLGSTQTDQFESHRHDIQDIFAAGSPGDQENFVAPNATKNRNTATTLNEGGSETRPRNIALNYIIKSEY